MFEMIVTVAFLTIAFALATFRRWQAASRPALESAVIESPYRYFYVSTVVRRLGVLAGFCLLVLIAVGGVGFALYIAVGQPLLSELLRQSAWVRFVVFSATVGAVFLLFALPPLRGAMRAFHYFLLRHLFFRYCLPGGKRRLSGG